MLPLLEDVTGLMNCQVGSLITTTVETNRYHMLLSVAYCLTFVILRFCFADRSCSSCGRGFKLWRMTEANLHRLSSPLLLPQWQKVMSVLSAKQIRMRERRGTLGVKRRGRKEMKSWGLMRWWKKEKRQLWSSRQPGGSTDRGYGTCHSYISEFVEECERKYYIKPVQIHDRRVFLFFSLHLHFSLYFQDVVMLQSMLRGHLLRESQLKYLLKDMHHKVFLTQSHSSIHVCLPCYTSELKYFNNISLD